MKRIEIVGGGLAGLALGIALRARDIPVRVREAGTYPRHRVCGEFLCGVSPATLRELGIDDLVGDAPELRTAGWYRDTGLAFAHRLPFAARGISRHTLDHRLALRFLARGGVLETRTRVPQEEWIAPGTVVASGRTPATHDALIGLKLHWTGLRLDQDLEMHCAEGGYIGLCPVDGGRVNASALFRTRPELKGSRDGLQRRYLLACGLHRLVERMDGVIADPESAAAVSAVSLGSWRLPPPTPWCGIGDRFAMIGPFTGNGMSMALESAREACEPLAEFAAGIRPWNETTRLVHRALRRRFGQRLFLSAMLHRLLFSGPGRSGLAAAGGRGWLPVAWLFRHLR
jgi:flavin-dependent dehydrogenase